MKKLIAGALGGAAIAVGALFGAGTANASVADDAYIATLDQFNVSYVTELGMIKMLMEFGRLLDSGDYPRVRIFHLWCSGKLDDCRFWPYRRCGCWRVLSGAPTMIKKLILFLAGIAIGLAVVASRPPVQAQGGAVITSIVYWTGPNCIPVRYSEGYSTNVAMKCGGYSERTYFAVPGQYVGADRCRFQ